MMFRFVSHNVKRIFVIKSPSTTYRVSRPGHHVSLCLRQIGSWLYPNKTQSRASWWVRHLLRAVPIWFITYTVYKTGYAMGLQEYAQDPVGMDNMLMKSMATRVSSSDDETAEEADPFLHADSPEYKEVSRIAIRVLTAAKSYADQQKKFYDTLSRRKVGFHEITDPEGAVIRTVDVDQQLRMWTEACTKLQGNWNLVLIRNETPNAFVTDLCPRRIFVHAGLLHQCKPTDDELGMVLAHEISHLLLGHVTSAMENILLTSVIQLIFLSLFDPFGILTLLMDYYSFHIVELFTAYHSRGRELEADALGLEIASLACFDVEKGAYIFKKFGDLEAGPPDPNNAGASGTGDGARRTTSWFDSHPASDIRFAILEEASKKYKHMLGSPDCNKWLRDFDRAVNMVMHASDKQHSHHHHHHNDKSGVKK